MSVSVSILVWGCVNSHPLQTPSWPSSDHRLHSQAAADTQFFPPGRESPYNECLFPKFVCWKQCFIAPTSIFRARSVGIGRIMFRHITLFSSSFRTFPLFLGRGGQGVDLSITTTLHSGAVVRCDVEIKGPQFPSLKQMWAQICHHNWECPLCITDWPNSGQPIGTV